MPNILLYLAVTFLLFSCGTDAGGGIGYRIDEKEKKIFIEMKDFPGKPAFEITVLSNAGDLNTAGDFCLNTLRLMKKYSKPYQPSSGTVRIGPVESWYQAYFQLAAFSLPEIKNDLIRYGIIQSEWRKWVRGSSGKNDPVSAKLRDYRYDLFLQEDLKDFLESSGCGWDDLDEIYAYEAGYLLKEILFISLQEMLSRPARYYNPREFQTGFFQMVTLPEAASFTRYLQDKYGTARTMKLAKTAFSTNEWTRWTGESFHDTEGDYTSGLEKKTHTGKLKDRAFREKLDSLLKLGNLTTKSTLFRK